MKREITDEMMTVEQLRQQGEQKRIEEQQIRAELNPLGVREPYGGGTAIRWIVKIRGALLEEQADLATEES